MRFLFHLCVAAVELEAMEETKFTPNPRTPAAWVSEKTAECTRSDEKVGLGVVQTNTENPTPMFSVIQTHLRLMLLLWQLVVSLGQNKMCSDVQGRDPELPLAQPPDPRCS